METEVDTVPEAEAEGREGRLTGLDFLLGDGHVLELDRGGAARHQARLNAPGSCSLT